MSSQLIVGQTVKYLKTSTELQGLNGIQSGNHCCLSVYILIKIKHKHVSGFVNYSA